MGRCDKPKGSEDEYVTRWEEMELLPGVNPGYRASQPSSVFCYCGDQPAQRGKGLTTKSNLEQLSLLVDWELDCAQRRSVSSNCKLRSFVRRE
jgi:hypothetical protein